MDIQKIREQVQRAALYEQLAEEAVELAHAALKYARILRGENPTPCDILRQYECIVEELGDVEIVACVAEIDMITEEYAKSKVQRWIDRLEDVKNA